MGEQNVAARMSSDWDSRAREDAAYYVAFGRRNQDDDEFFSSAADVLRAIGQELRRKDDAFWRSAEALEIGCGPGRLLKPLSSAFRKVHGIDISEEMLRRAESYLAGIPNVALHHAKRSDLSHFADQSVDFIYSYAVFQHIPDREVIFNYMNDAVRILNPGGIFFFQINGLPDRGHKPTTWNGARVSAEEMIEFAKRHSLLLLGLTGQRTQYMWVTLQKRWAPVRTEKPSCKVRRITNAYSGEPAIPSSGRFGAVSVWTDGLPDDCDLLELSALVDGVSAIPTYVSPPTNRLRQFNFLLPKGTRTGLVPVDVLWNGQSLFGVQWATIIPAGPRVPRICTLSDGTNLLSEYRIETGSGKLVMEEVAEPERVRIRLEDVEVQQDAPFCVDPLHDRYEFNFWLPENVSTGAHHLDVSIGQRTIGRLAVEVA
jgi:SAM-dependent methyltransferase